MWYEEIVKHLQGAQIINDSKTPSGRIHVGSLRGILIHDAVYRAVKQAGIPVTYLYGIDDYDPLDGLPADGPDNLRAYMGFPLCKIPPPTSSTATNLAEHYIGEFLGIFEELGVGARIYRMTDVYGSGQLNKAIDVILRKSAVVRKVYAEVSNSVRPENWHPFQVICENCGRIGTTEVTEYDGHEVTYRCRPDLVRWATGCGYAGKVSPFDGHGKLPWKLEWAAKWHTFGITIEGAGKDHCTKGGSREVAARCLQAIFGDNPPLNIPYEFLLVEGAKMSSSRGVGTAAREIADFLPPEILRFLMIRTPPKKAVNFSTDYEYMVKLFNEHDRILSAKLAGTISEADGNVLDTIEVDPLVSTYHPVSFQLTVALLQMPHLNVEQEIIKRFGGHINDADRKHLIQRLQAAKYWLVNYASDADRFELQDQLSPSANSLSVTQKAFLNLLAEHLPGKPITDDEYQTLIFDVARITPIDQSSAFKAIYCVLLDKDRGPKGGSLLAFLDRAFLQTRFRSILFSRDEFFDQTGITGDAFEGWIGEHLDSIRSLSIRKSVNIVVPDEQGLTCKDYCHGRGVLEVSVHHQSGKTRMQRILFSDFEGYGINSQHEAEYLERYGNDWIDQLRARFAIPIDSNTAPLVTYEQSALRPTFSTSQTVSSHIH